MDAARGRPSASRATRVTLGMSRLYLTHALARWIEDVGGVNSNRSVQWWYVTATHKASLPSSLLAGRYQCTWATDVACRRNGDATETQQGLDGVATGARTPCRPRPVSVEVALALARPATRQGSSCQCSKSGFKRCDQPSGYRRGGA
jgi:hypothetical protein